MMKKLLVVLMCLISVCLCGCASDPAYTIYQTEDGKVYETVFVPFSATELRNAGVNDESLILNMKNRIFNEVVSFYNNYDSSYRSRIAGDTALSLEDRQYLLSAVDIKTEPSEVTETANGIYFSIEYDSVISYYYFKFQGNYTELVEWLKEDDAVVESNPFYYNEINTGVTVFGQNVLEANKTLALSIQDTTRNWLSLNTLLSNEVIESLVPNNFVYRYGTPSLRLHSNADNIFSEQGIVFHEWNVSSDTTDKEVKTWTTHANKQVWYIVILGGGFVLAGVLFAIDFILCKTKNSKKNTEIEIINNDM